jgi:FAD/FMN-containing dehydrogenase/Fe-S oxidoreductase
MIPAISSASPVQEKYLAFINALKAKGFEGDLSADYANRVVLATDNSIYQVLPQGVLYPKNSQDLVRIAELSSAEPFQDIVVSPRGGGTGTNGQSLTDGLIVDVSKHMNKILEINAEEGWARVEAGVVKDQLNEAIKPYGLFFAPELSTSNRATIGGMINTDASGQGSCSYGKTRDHVLELKTVLLDGCEWLSSPIDDAELNVISEREDRVGDIHRLLDSINKDYASEIEATFPKLNRCLTGYDLAHIRNDDGKFDLNSILCGSEGTLGFIAEAKVNLLKTPKYSALVNIMYADFNAALRDANELIKAEPTSIETIDSKVLNLAKDDIVWNSVAEFFPTQEGQQLEAINLVEYTADDEDVLRSHVQKLTDNLDSGSSVSFGYSVAWNDSVNKIWGMRKKSVGLLGNIEGEARPMPFVEDTAVPPENLADYILEFRALLDSHNLQYGMFGHVDAGVLHVRPILDMKDPKQEALIRTISDGVVELTSKYNGLIWGEHGKGVRSEYSPTFFGALYPVLERIKAAFDPRDQLNPGKIATTGKKSLLKIDEVNTRGQEDRKIPVQIWNEFSEAAYCNGNGGCYNYNPNDPMCPSWKGTRLRTHSPKGRASLVREWIKQMSDRDIDLVAEGQNAQQKNFIVSLFPRIKNSWSKLRGEYDFSHEIHESMMACLACKACAGQCPVKVNVPEFRSKFLALYYGRYLRPLKDYVVGGLEYMMPVAAKVSWLYNILSQPKLMQAVFNKGLGMSDSPALTGIDLAKELPKHGIRFASAETIAQMSAEDKQRAVIVVQDAFTSYFETQLIIDIIKLLSQLGFVPLLASFKPNGKPLHVHGFMKAFNRAAKVNAAQLKVLADSGIPLVGVDPSMTLSYRDEYIKTLGAAVVPKVQLLQEWLVTKAEVLASNKQQFKATRYALMAHCTEKTNAAASMKDWQEIFSALGAGATNP